VHPTSPSPTRRRRHSCRRAPDDPLPSVTVPYPGAHAQRPASPHVLRATAAEQSSAVAHRSPIARRRQVSLLAFPAAAAAAVGRYPGAHEHRRATGSQRECATAARQSAWSRHGHGSSRRRRGTHDERRSGSGRRPRAHTHRRRTHRDPAPNHASQSASPPHAASSRRRRTHPPPPPPSCPPPCCGAYSTRHAHAPPTHSLPFIAAAQSDVTLHGDPTRRRAHAVPSSTARKPETHSQRAAAPHWVSGRAATQSAD